MESAANIIITGILIGALISAPMGPIGMLVIQRTLNKGRMPAFVTGIGAALSDLIYCLLTGLGLSFVTDFIESNQNVLQVIGSLVLIIYGIYLFRNNPSRQLRTPAPQASNYWRDFATGFLLTFSNPLILFFIIGLFARFNFIQPEYAIHHYIVAYAAIFCGAILWWYGVTALVGHLGKRINMRSLKLINRIIGFILAAMAVAGVCMAIIEHL